MIKYSHYAPHRTRLFKGEGRLRRGVFAGFHLTRGDNSGVIWMNSCGFECSANSFGVECLEKGGPEDREEILLVHRMQGALFEGVDCIVHSFFIFAKQTTSSPWRACVQCGGYTRHTILWSTQYWTNSRERCEMCPSRMMTRTLSPAFLLRERSNSFFSQSRASSESVHPFGLIANLFIVGQ